MTEKRFGIGKIECENDYDIWYVDEICDNGRILSDDEIVKLLNELHEENRLLKIALCEELQDNGNKAYIERFDELFDLNYNEWEQKNEYHDWGIE